MIYGNAIGGSGGGSGGSSIDSTFIIEDADGNELVGIVVDEEVIFTATENDIRKGTVAATQIGVTEGTKEIPNYRATEGYTVIKPGDDITIKMFSDMCEYTTFQGLICGYNTTPYDSVSTEKVVLLDRIYPVGSTTVLSDISVDSITQSINIGLINNREYSVVVHFMIIKEDT